MKRKNVTVNKKRIEIISRRKSVLYLWKNNLKKIYKSINYWKVEDLYHYTDKHRGAANSIYNLRSNVPNGAHVVFHNCSSCDYLFIIKELANGLQGEFECLIENTEKYKTFSIPIEKEVTKIDKDGNKTVVTKSWKIKFNESVFNKFIIKSYCQSRRRNS